MYAGQRVFTVHALHAIASYERLLSIVADTGPTETPVDLRQVEKIRPLTPSEKRGQFFATGLNDDFALVVPPAAQTVVFFKEQLDSDGNTFRPEPVFLRTSIFRDPSTPRDLYAFKSELDFIEAAKKIPGLIDLNPPEIPAWPKGTPWQHVCSAGGSNANGFSRGATLLAWTLAISVTTFVLAADATKIVRDNLGCYGQTPSRSIVCRTAQMADRFFAPIFETLSP